MPRGRAGLVAACSSPLSRNRAFGTHLGHGLSIEQATGAHPADTEGVKSAEAILAKNRTAMSRNRAWLRPRSERDHNGSHHHPGGP
ncbi:NAD(P)H-dependent glycerol-3-phosphate dehydrogenase [Streptomyces sp. NPDC097981]|uniref:NAD(P)H-dependent glycerol-3-phosphate dehydrogenase n=1 Tax=Streptomyces sp. NPDC097981 TaxID=3155428 RepID=UPI00331EAAE8